MEVKHEALHPHCMNPVDTIQLFALPLNTWGHVAIMKEACQHLSGRQGINLHRSPASMLRCLRIKSRQRYASAQELGVDEAVDYHGADFAEVYADQPFDAIVDLIGGMLVLFATPVFWASILLSSLMRHSHMSCNTSQNVPHRCICIASQKLMLALVTKTTNNNSSAPSLTSFFYSLRE